MTEQQLAQSGPKTLSEPFNFLPIFEDLSSMFSNMKVFLDIEDEATPTPSYANFDLNQQLQPQLQNQMQLPTGGALPFHCFGYASPDGGPVLPTKSLPHGGPNHVFSTSADPFRWVGGETSASVVGVVGRPGPLEARQASVLSPSAPVFRPQKSTGDVSSPPQTSVSQVFDPDFKLVYSVPTKCVVHLPPPRLNITRLVRCRNYRPHEPTSCTMGDSCKFIHADCNYDELESHSIHVNYIWRHEDLCTYPRMPPGDVLEVLQPNGQPPLKVSSALALRTRGALGRDEIDGGALMSCPDYDYAGLCKLGERCLAVHRVTVDPTVKGDFKRASRKLLNNLASRRVDFTGAGMPIIRNDSPPAFDEQAKVMGAAGGGVPPLPPPLSAQDPSTGGFLKQPHPFAAGGGQAGADAGLPPSIVQRLQQTLMLQHAWRNTPVAVPPPPMNFSIQPSQALFEALADPSSMGVLLFLPRGSTEATMLGPISPHTAMGGGGFPMRRPRNH